MSKKLKYTLFAIDLIITVGVVFAVLNWTHLKNFPSIISSYYAKEFCSCYFVVGQPEEFCHNYVRQYIPISKFSLDKEKKSVTVSGLGMTNSAVFTSQRYGCEFQ